MSKSEQIARHAERELDREIRRQQRVQKYSRVKGHSHRVSVHEDRRELRRLGLA